MQKALDDYPELMTIEEAAEYLRISRATGYQLARQYRITGGSDGLPVCKVGRGLRVVRSELANLIARGAPPLRR